MVNVFNFLNDKHFSSAGYSVELCGMPWGPRLELSVFYE